MSRRAGHRRAAGHPPCRCPGNRRRALTVPPPLSGMAVPQRIAGGGASRKTGPRTAERQAHRRLIGRAGRAGTTRVRLHVLGGQPGRRARCRRARGPAGRGADRPSRRDRRRGGRDRLQEPGRRRPPGWARRMAVATRSATTRRSWPSCLASGSTWGMTARRCRRTQPGGRVRRRGGRRTRMPTGAGTSGRASRTRSGSATGST